MTDDDVVVERWRNTFLDDEVSFRSADFDSFVVANRELHHAPKARECTIQIVTSRSTIRAHIVGPLSRDTGALQKLTSCIA